MLNLRSRLQGYVPLKKQAYARYLWAGLSFFLPIFILLAYLFLGQGVYPAGPQSILTVDLGQQYIDFYAYYHHTLQGHGGDLLYSFSKALGGEMLGTWSYYLMSPFLLLTLLGDLSQLPIWAYVMVALKIGFAGLNFYLLLAHFYRKAQPSMVIFALSYALMGYFQANQMNIMWLDGPMILPLIILGIEKIHQKQDPLLYPLALAYGLITNYYIGYMLALFSGLYFLYSWWCRSRQGKVFYQFIKKSLLALALSAYVLLPTFFSLLKSKAAQGFPNWTFELKLSLPQLLSKFYLGAFNFDQLPKGYPNIYVGGLALLFAFAFFWNKKIKSQEKWAAFFLLSFLIASFFLAPLDLLWHGFQYPIWYPARFSFTFSFFLIWLAYRSFHCQQKLPGGLASLLVMGSGLLTLYLYKHRSAFPYLSLKTILISWGLFLAYLLLFYFQKPKNYFLPLALFLLVPLELTSNLTLTLDSISYLDHKDYTAYLADLKPLTKSLPEVTQQFYRLGKNFERTKNDALSLQYFGTDHFNSTLEQKTIDFYKALGLATTSGSVNYSSGTLLTDQLFALGYALTAAEKSASQLEERPYHLRLNNWRPDWRAWPLKDMHQGYALRKRPGPSNLAYLVTEEVQNLNFADQEPIANQEALLQAIAPLEHGEKYFERIPFYRLRTTNIESDEPKYIQTVYRPKANDKVAYVDLTLRLETPQAYYLTLPGHFKPEDVDLKWDGQKLPYDAAYPNGQILNIAANEPGETHILSVKIKKEQSLHGLYLYQLAPKKLERAFSPAVTGSFQLKHFSDAYFTGTVESKQDRQVLMLSMPYDKDWEVLVNGQKGQLIPLMQGGFQGLKLPKAGHYDLVFRFRPQGLRGGFLLSLSALGGVGYQYFRKRGGK